MIPLTRFFVPLLALCALTDSTAAADYVGSDACANCHRGEYESWRGSHHDLAMQRPSEETVLGDFDDARFEYNGAVTRFYRRGDDFLVSTVGPDGEIQEYRVEWVFGVAPLQQYLLPLDRGRLQALSVAWDARPAEAGGQRWYHLYPDEAIAYDDPLHWTGPYQNWNTRCAECHSTDVRKNYDPAARSFDTVFAEEDVACEACHGPGGDHLQRAWSGQRMSGGESGLLSLADRGIWAFPEGASIARRQTPPQGRVQIDSCGRCHARRSTLGEYRHGQPLSDTHRLALLGEPLYHHDGQILDEVYVYGSFVQSKMQQAGVVCSNCHEPHSNRLRAPGNGVCAQCHKAATYDTPEHHHHPADSVAGACVSCHMPERTYMGVDARRDHSMRVPRPDLSVMIGTPNACNDCHSDHEAQWAVDTLREWGSPPRGSGNHPAVAMAELARGDTRAVPRLLALAADGGVAPIWRATALDRSASVDPGQAANIASSLLISDDPLLRVSAVRALRTLPLQRRFAALWALRDDPVAGVRMEVATALADVPMDQLDAERRSELQSLFREYVETQRRHADMPSIQMQLAIFLGARGDFPAAEAAYREAILINPQLLPARLNLADLLRGMGREEEARAQIHAALAVAPDSGDARHALGLLEARAGNGAAALENLAAAAAVETAGFRHRYVYAIALHDFGNVPEALETLRSLHRELPAQEEVLLALTNYSAEAGDTAAARRYVQRLLRLAPDNPGYRQLAASLSAGG
jgi:predicted CXXCH cytochrome family protein